MQIPKDFILHSVRIGAVKGMLFELEQRPQNPVELHSDGTVIREKTGEIYDGALDANVEVIRLRKIAFDVLQSQNIDGLTWANEQFKNLDKVKKLKIAEEKQRITQDIFEKKERILEDVQLHMRDESFRFTPEQIESLKNDFYNKLTQWKAILEGGFGLVAQNFISEHGDKEITSDIFLKFKRLYETSLTGNERRRLPLEIIDPTSGCFSVCILNKVTTLREFTSAAYSNMNSWFVL